jgi:O-antigen/teichoic acid export membrane protein
VSSVLPSPRGFGAALRGDRPLQSLLRSIGTQVLIVLMNVLTGVITARALGAEGRGIYAAVTLWPPLLGMLATAGLGSAVVFRLRRTPASVSQVTGAAMSLGLAYSVVLIAAGVFLLPLFMNQYSRETVWFAQGCLIAVAFNGVQIVMRQSFAGLGQYWNSNLTHLLPQALHLILLVVLLLVTTLVARDAVLALLASSALTVLFILPRFLRAMRPQFRRIREEARALTSYAMRAAPTGLVSALLLFSDRLVLLPLLPIRELGIYAVAFSFSRVVQLVQPALQSVFLSQMAAQDAVASQRTHDHAVRLLLTALLIGCSVLWLVGEWLLGFAYGAEFIAANTIFRVLILEASLAVLSQATSQLFMARDRPGTVSTIQAVMLGVSLLLLLLLVPRYGGLGAAVALAITGALRWITLLVAMSRVFATPLPRLYPNQEDWRFLAARLRR